ncbi:unnamed protein product, partial [Cuscuta campestris]
HQSVHLVTLIGLRDGLHDQYCYLRVASKTNYTLSVS